MSDPDRDATEAFQPTAEGNTARGTALWDGGDRTETDDLGVGSAASAPLIGPGDEVQHFRVVRLLGRGGMGEVYLARDTVLGRKVALKVLHPKALGSRRAVERFLFEARATARFADPHIVTVYAAGEHRGYPFVALEYLEGQTLRQRMHTERLSVQQSARIGLAIAEALAVAHRHDLLHRDLKPGNVMIPRDGRVRVLDFGLAKTVGEAALAPPDDSGEVAAGAERPFEITAGLCGTPAYLAPEAWTEGGDTPARDVWALGLILHELITGRHPYAEQGVHELCYRICEEDPIPPIAGDVPYELSQLVAGCLAKDPAERIGLAALIDGLRSFLEGTALPRSGTPSPFRGLLPFSERHAAQFFGRDAEIASFLERLRNDPVLTVVGASGAGKSSFVYAGVIPRLREQGRCVVVGLKPGRRPVRTLASRLLTVAAAGSSSLLFGSQDTRSSSSGSLDRTPGSGEVAEHGRAEQALAGELREAPGSLALQLQALAEREHARVVLFVDQLEEAFTLVEDDAERRAFLDAVCLAADDPDGPVRAIFTIRDDFLGRLAGGRISREALSRVTVLTTPGPEALEEIVDRPVAGAGYAFDDPALVADMVAAVAGEPAALPLLQFTGRVLWERRDREHKLLRRAVYDRVGGVAGALAHHADGILAAMSPEQVRWAREILLRLVSAQQTRRVVPRRMLTDGLGDGADEVVDRLVEERVLLVRKARSGKRSGAALRRDDAEIELVHESLIRTWDRLARWIDESRDEMVFLAEVGRACELWEKGGGRSEEVWQGDALHDAVRRARRMRSVPGNIQRFLDAGLTRERARTRRRQWILASGVAVVLVFGLAMGLVARQAIQRRQEAEIQRAEVQREGARAALLRGSVLEARAKMRASLETQDSALARTLWWQLRQEPLRWSHDLGSFLYAVDYSPDGEVVAVGAQDGMVYLFGAHTAELSVLRGHTDQVLTVAFSPDGAMLASGTLHGELGVWDLRQGTRRVMDTGAPSVRDVAFSPDGQRLASADGDGDVTLWDPRTSTAMRTFSGHEGPAYGVDFSPDGATLASTGDDATVRLWSVDGAREPAVLRGHTDKAFGLDFSPDGRTLVTGSFDGTIRTWDAVTGESQQVLEGDKYPIYARSLAFSPDGATLAVPSSSGTVALWDAETGVQRDLLEGHTERVRGVHFSPDGDALATVAFDATVRVWGLSRRASQIAPRGHEAAAYAVGFSPDDRLLASGGTDQTIRFWDVASGRERKTFPEPGGTTEGLAFGPDGATVATAVGNAVRIRDVGTLGERSSLHDPDAPVLFFDISPDGSRIVTRSPASLLLWDAASATRLAVLQGGGVMVGIGPAGRRVGALTEGGDLQLWDAGTGAPLGTNPAACGRTPRRAAFGAAATEVVILDQTGGLSRWDLERGGCEAIGDQQGRMTGLAVSPDGRQIAAASSATGLLLWDAARREATALRGHRGDVNRLRFSHDGRLLASVGDDTTVRLWDAATGRPAWHAVALLGGPAEAFTHEGWVSLERDEAPRAATRWRAAIEERGFHAERSADGEALCLATHGDTLELWDLAADEPIAEVAMPAGRTLRATADGCVALDGAGQAYRVRRGGEVATLRDDAVALGATGETILVATATELTVVGIDGLAGAPRAVDAGVEALAQVGPWFAVGYREGNVELLPAESGTIAEPPDLEDAPASRVTRLLAGPEGTLIAGYGNGELVIWNIDDGVRLMNLHLHGPVSHLLLQHDRLYAATELGDHEALDLSVFTSGYCDLMRAVWDEVPVVWRDGRAEEAPPSPSHECAE